MVVVSQLSIVNSSSALHVGSFTLPLGFMRAKIGNTERQMNK